MNNIVKNIKTFSTTTYYEYPEVNKTIYYDVFLTGSPTIYFQPNTDGNYTVYYNFFEKYTNGSLTLKFEPPVNGIILFGSHPGVGIISGNSLTIDGTQLNFIHKIKISMFVVKSNIYIKIDAYKNMIVNNNSRGKGYKLYLNDSWRKSPTVKSPAINTYDGVYESFKNKGVHNSEDVMTIMIYGYTSFKFYIRSYGEGNYDYVMVSQLDKIISKDVDYTSTLVKAHTRGNSTPTTDITSYTLVEFTGLNYEEHFINILYKKDGSQSNGTDAGYVLIPKNQ